jgi:hypothetical protein
MVDKYVNNKGEVAALISYGYGAGWTTWGNSDLAEAKLFDPELVKAVLDYPTDPHGSMERRKEIAARKYPGEYQGGLDDIKKVTWIKQGTKFYIDEYDGAEGLRTEEDLSFVA